MSYAKQAVRVYLILFAIGSVLFAFMMGYLIGKHLGGFGSFMTGVWFCLMCFGAFSAACAQDAVDQEEKSQ